LGEVWGRPRASSSKRSKNKPPQATFAPFVNNMVQESDRYLLPVFQATPPRFGPLTQVDKFTIFEKFSLLNPLAQCESVKFGTLVGSVDTRKGKNWGPSVQFLGVMGVKVSTFPFLPQNLVVRFPKHFVVGSEGGPLQTLKIS